MSITYVDTDFLERMRDEMSRVLSRLEECAGTLRQMHSQMLTEDLQLSYYPQWEQAVEHCDSARRKADVLSETAERFLMILKSAPEEYRQLEQMHTSGIENLNVRMRTLGAGLMGVMAAEYPTGLAEGGQDSQAMKLEQQVSLSAQAMEAASLLAVTLALKEEYAYDYVVPGIPSLSEEEEDDRKKERNQNLSFPGAHVSAANVPGTYPADRDEEEGKGIGNQSYTDTKMPGTSVPETYSAGRDGEETERNPSPGRDAGETREAPGRTKGTREHGGETGRDSDSNPMRNGSGERGA